MITNRTNESHDTNDENEGLLPTIGVEDGGKQREVGCGRNGNLKMGLPTHDVASE